MGRVTIFTTSGCPHCVRAKSALKRHDLAFTEIDVEKNPERRSDMLQLTDKFSVPQIFFNERLVGGADDLMAQLGAWYDDHCLVEQLEQVLKGDPPMDHRLAPTKETAATHALAPEFLPPTITLPDGSQSSVMQVTQVLDHLLDSDDRAYNAHTYKNCFVNTEAVKILKENYNLSSTKAAVDWGKKLQEANILHHVCGDHTFREDGYYFFRLQKYHQPDVLNSLCVWPHQESIPGLDYSEYAQALLKRLKSKLDFVLSRFTNDEGLINYVAVLEDPDFAEFEFAACELQALDLLKLDETSRFAAGLNLYNLCITYAFVKMGIGTTSMGRGAFFSQVFVNVGGHLLSFNDLEHGILRANKRHPYATRKTFDKNDSRRPLALSDFDERLHFALNCGAKSCPPVKFFHKECLAEELRVVAQSFCEKDEVVSLDEEKQEMTVSMLFKWYERDFCASREHLPLTITSYLWGEKKEALNRMLAKPGSISVRYQPYDWSANANDYKVFKRKTQIANAYSPATLLSCVVTR